MMSKRAIIRTVLIVLFFLATAIAVHFMKSDYAENPWSLHSAANEKGPEPAKPELTDEEIQKNLQTPPPPLVPEATSQTH